VSRSVVPPSDLAGAETLEIMQAAPQYNSWQFRRIASFLGRRICEVGAGIGNISALIHGVAPDVLLLTDTDAHYREVLRARFSRHPEVNIEELTLPDGGARARLQHYALDTVVALNVIEHIGEDIEAMRSMAGMLQPGGKVVVLVPALQVLYGSLDRELGHVRRYTRRTIAERMRLAGLRVERIFYFNLIGTIGWWVNARVRQTPRIPLSQLRYFDALVPALALEDHVQLPFGQSVIAIGVAP
jgi:SAM-dependent methyltransferase